MNEEADRSTRAGVPMHNAVLNRQHGLLPGKRLADDRGEKSRSRLVRLARPDIDGRQPDTDAIQKTAPAIVGKQQLDHRLLGAVRRQRRVMEFVRDGLGKRRAEYRDGRGEYKSRAIA